MIVLVTSDLWMPVSSAASLPRVESTDGAAASFANGVELRVLSIGDSITSGTHWSSDAGGYLSRLYKLMKQQFSNSIHLVGAQHSGSSTEDHHEGHSTFSIKQIEDASKTGIYKAPNIVLLHAGTNDLERGDVKNGIPDLIHLMNAIFEKSPNTVVFICQLIPSKSSATDARITQFNKDIVSEVVPHFEDKHVVLVDMNTDFNKDNLHDDLHPNDDGYQDMANRFMKAMKDNEKLITAPGTPHDPPQSSIETG